MRFEFKWMLKILGYHFESAGLECAFFGKCLKVWNECILYENTWAFSRSIYSIPKRCVLCVEKILSFNTRRIPLKNWIIEDESERNSIFSQWLDPLFSWKKEKIKCNNDAVKRQPSKWPLIMTVEDSFDLSVLRVHFIFFTVHFCSFDRFFYSAI